MLMYHLVRVDPQQPGDIILFAEGDEPLEGLYDWKELYRSEWKLNGTFRLTLESGQSNLPGSMEN